jgi:nucleoid DNA-binding protein
LKYRYEVKGTTAKCYTFTAQVDNLAEAQRVAKAKFREINKEETTFSCEIPGNTRFVSGANISLSGLGVFDGKYYIDKATHSVGSGYTTSIEAHKIVKYVEIIPATIPKAAAAATSNSADFKENDVVRVKSSASKYYPGSCGIPSWVKSEYKHVIMQTTLHGKPAVKGGKVCVLLGNKISIKTGRRMAGIMSWIAIENIEHA